MNFLKLRRGLGLLRTAWTLLLPFAVHWALSSESLSALLPFLLVGLALNLAQLKHEAPANPYLRLLGQFVPTLAFAMSLSITIVFGLSSIWGKETSARFLPAVTNVGFFLVFSASLLREPPIIERFARVSHFDLSAAEIRHCRRATWAWSAFFLFNAGTITLLALSPFTRIWLLYTGVLAYVLVGFVGASEYLVRRLRFGRLTQNPIDRLLAMVLKDSPLVQLQRLLRGYSHIEVVECQAELLRYRARAPAEHPSFAGHFPGLPVLPGVVQVRDLVLAPARQIFGLEKAQLASMRRIKFQRPLLPGDLLEVSLKFTQASSQVQFTIQLAEATQLAHPLAGSFSHPACAQGNFQFAASLPSEHPARANS